MSGHTRGIWVSRTVIKIIMMKILNFVFRKRRGIFFFKLIRLKRRSQELPRGHNQSHQHLPLKTAIPSPPACKEEENIPGGDTAILPPQ
jgi:hypothetical protein